MLKDQMCPLRLPLFCSYPVKMTFHSSHWLEKWNEISNGGPEISRQSSMFTAKRLKTCSSPAPTGQGSTIVLLASGHNWRKLHCGHNLSNTTRLKMPNVERRRSKKLKPKKTKKRSIINYRKVNKSIDRKVERLLSECKETTILSQCRVSLPAL